jgi:hypothetical protein
MQNVGGILYKKSKPTVLKSFIGIAESNEFLPQFLKYPEMLFYRDSISSDSVHHSVLSLFCMMAGTAVLVSVPVSCEKGSTNFGPVFWS